MTRQEFFEWLDTCPVNTWLLTEDNVESKTVRFFYEEDEGGEE